MHNSRPVAHVPRRKGFLVTGGIVAKLKKSQISKTEALATSLMPPGWDKTLSATELRDLMTYLLTEAPR